MSWLLLGQPDVFHAPMYAVVMHRRIVLDPGGARLDPLPFCSLLVECRGYPLSRPVAMSTPDQRVDGVRHDAQPIQIAQAKCQGQAISCGETRP